MEKSLIFPKRYIVVDLETTGLSPSSCEIIEFTGLKIENGIVVDKFSTLIRPKIVVSPFITSLTGITNEMLKNQPNFMQVANDILVFLSDEIILGHNISFDMNFLKYYYEMYFGVVLRNERVDLLRIVRKIFPNWHNHKLGTVAKNMNLKFQPTHRAENDCLATFEAFEICRELYKVKV